MLRRRKGLPDGWVGIVEAARGGLACARRRRAGTARNRERLAAPAQALGGVGRVRAHRRDHGDDRGAGRAPRARPERRRVPRGQRDHRLPDGDAIARHLRRSGRHRDRRGRSRARRGARRPRSGVARVGPGRGRGTQPRHAARTSCSTSSRTSSTCATPSSTARRGWNARTWPSGSRCAPRRTRRSGSASTGHRCSPTARRTPRSSSRSRPRPSSTCRSRSSEHEPALYGVMRTLLRAGPCRARRRTEQLP